MVTDIKLSSTFAHAIAFAERSVEATEKTGDTNAMYIAVRNRDRKKMTIYFRKSTLDHGLSTALAQLMESNTDVRKLVSDALRVYRKRTGEQI
mgnify:CR=1 FL=1